MIMVADSCPLYLYIWTNRQSWWTWRRGWSMRFCREPWEKCLTVRSSSRMYRVQVTTGEPKDKTATWTHMEANVLLCIDTAENCAHVKLWNISRRTNPRHPCTLWVTLKCHVGLFCAAPQKKCRCFMIVSCSSAFSLNYNYSEVQAEKISVFFFPFVFCTWCRPINSGSVDWQIIDAELLQTLFHSWSQWATGLG